MQIIKLCGLRRDGQVPNRNPLLKLNRFLIAVTFALTPVILDAQEIAIGNDDSRPLEERVIYNRESTLHATIHTQGLGAGYKYGIIRGIHKTTYWNFEVSYLRSQKQIRLMNYFSPTSFVYGKLNDVLALRGGYEVERRIYGKPYWGGIEVRWLYGAGASLAILKPYYYSVVVAKPTATGTYEQTIEYQTFDNKDQWIEILGKAPFKQGLDEMRLRPGVYAKGGMVYEIGTSRLRAQSIEVGAMVEYYPQGLSLMADNPISYVIPTLYLSYSWGTRFNKY